MCDGKRVAHLPDTLDFLESSLIDPKFRAPKVLDNLIRSFYLILHFERKRDLPNPEIISRIIKNNLGKMNQIMREQIDRINESIENVSQTEKEQRDAVRMCVLFGNILYFLAETGEEKAVDMMFDLAIRLPKKEYENIKRGIERSLFSPEWTLYKNHHNIINDKLYDMIKSEDPTIKERGIDLEKAKQNIRYYV